MLRNHVVSSLPDARTGQLLMCRPLRQQTLLHINFVSLTGIVTGHILTVLVSRRKFILGRPLVSTKFCKVKMPTIVVLIFFVRPRPNIELFMKSSTSGQFSSVI